MVLALISACVTASHRAEARSLRKLSLHCPCCWVTTSAPHMTPNDNNKLHPKMLNGAGIAGRWSCCLHLSVWALEPGSLRPTLLPVRVFMGSGPQCHSFLDAPVAPMGLLTAAVGKDQGAALVAPSWGLAPSAWGRCWPPPPIPPAWNLLCLPGSVVARGGAQGSYPPWKASLWLVWLGTHTDKPVSPSGHYRNKIWQLHQSGLNLAHHVKGSDYWESSHLH